MSNVEYWNAKLDENIGRDRRVEGALEAMGWRPIVVWECETYDLALLERRLQSVIKEAIVSQALSANSERRSLESDGSGSERAV